MEDRRFDALTRTLAQPISRRQVFKAVLATALGGLLARAGNGHVFASGGSSDCAQWCASVFAEDTPAAGRCTSDAAHHGGPCYQCGPAAPPGRIFVNGACAQTCDPALIPPLQRPFCNAAFTCVCASTTDGDLCIGIPSGAPGCLGGPQGCPAGTVCMAISGADGSPGLTVHCLQACTADTNCPSGQVCLTRGGTSGGCAAICS